MRELPEGDESVPYLHWHIGYTGVYSCQKSSKHIHLQYGYITECIYIF